MLVSVDDVAHAFGVSCESVRAWENDGKIPKAQRTLGNHRRWRTEELAPLLTSRGFEVPAAWIERAA